jgi:hypothetical protein
MLRVSKVRFNYERLPGGDAKRILLRAIERAEKVLPLNAPLFSVLPQLVSRRGWVGAG